MLLVLNWCRASYSPLPTEIGQFQVIFPEGVPFFVFTLSLINLTCTFICRLVDQRVCIKLKKRSKGDVETSVCGNHLFDVRGVKFKYVFTRERQSCR